MSFFFFPHRESLLLATLLRPLSHFNQLPQSRARIRPASLDAQRQKRVPSVVHFFPHSSSEQSNLGYDLFGCALRASTHLFFALKIHNAKTSLSLSRAPCVTSLSL